MIKKTDKFLITEPNHSAETKMFCTLCNSVAILFHQYQKRAYFKCKFCRSVVLHPDHYLCSDMEKERYEKHNNDVNDLGYQAFVYPVTDAIQNKFNASCHTGLDFGAGTGPVITSMLKKQGFHVDLYDPFFWNDPSKLDYRYDFIFCCEVIEHFHHPAREFKLLRSLLNPGGSLFCMTDFYSEETNFPGWYYKNDETHVFFYHKKAMKWIQENFGFSRLIITNRLAELIL